MSEACSMLTFGFVSWSVREGKPARLPFVGRFLSVRTEVGMGVTRGLKGAKGEAVGSETERPTTVVEKEVALEYLLSLDARSLKLVEDTPSMHERDITKHVRDVCKKKAWAKAD